MSSDRLRSTLYYSALKPASMPAPPRPTTAAARTTAAPASAPRQPATSAVRAGWICVGIGMLTAWLFPLAHVFFSLAVVLSVVAMATHQVRAGFLLLAGGMAGSVFCALLFVVGVAAAFQAAVARQPGIRPAALPVMTFVAPTPLPTIRYRAPVPVEGVVSGQPRRENVRPLALDEVLAMLNDGQTNDQIIAAIAGRPLPETIGPSEATNLRAYGADERLISVLRTRQAPGGSRQPASYSSTRSVAPVVPVAPVAPVSQTTTAPAATPPPLDRQARDRQIESLKSQLATLDEQMRRIRADPKDYRYQWHYASARYAGIDQAALDAYLKELDRQRDELRRQKWALEGR